MIQSALELWLPKALFYNVFIEAIPTKAANLLKQTFLAKGAEVAVARGTADLSVEKTDVLICATVKQYRQALAQLGQQALGLAERCPRQSQKRWKMFYIPYAETMKGVIQDGL